MSLFRNNKKRNAQPLSDTENDSASYDQVVDFLVAVNKADFDKIIKVANIYRGANIEVAKATGVRPETPPSIFERQTVPIVKTGQGESNFLDDDDELMRAFEGSEPDEPEPAPKTKKPANSEKAA